MPLNSPTPNKPAGRLYVVATPIGHLADITIRAIDVLTCADLIAAEDTRHTRKLLTAHGIDTRLVSYHEHNERQRTHELIQRIEQGESIALVSDAGTPSVSDPGFRLVQAAIERNIEIIPIPGVSAAMTAVSVSGLPTDSFTFLGFPPRKKNKRVDLLRDVGHLPQTLIFYQSPQRISGFIDELLAVMGDRHAVLAREMTKIHEEFIRGPLSHIQARLREKEALKGECTLLVAGASVPAPPDARDLTALLCAAMQRSDRPLAEIVKALARDLRVPRKQVYDLALKVKKEAAAHQGRR